MAEIDWKSIAIERRLENKMIKKRCKELTISRDMWKKKAIERKTELDQSKKQVDDIKKNIQKISHM